MQIKLLKKDRNKSVFLVKGTSPAYINTIRRAVTNNVPTMAIEDVNFVENDSAMYDEILAHRMGLVVFRTDLKSYNIRDECKCKGKGCPRCELKMTLSIKGPCTVYAGDIRTKDAKVKPAYPKTPLVKIMKGQAINLTATAVLGRGEGHMKFSPALVYYQGYPTIKVGKCKACGKCVRQCPKKILEVKGKKAKVTDILKCDLCKACEDACPNKAITVEGSREDFMLTAEPWGQLAIKDMFTAAIGFIDGQLDEMAKGVKKKNK